MALENVEFISIFLNDSTVWLIALVKDKDLTLVDPTSINISIWDPSGTLQVDEEAMTKHDSETGIYEYFYHLGVDAEPMDKGEWPVEVKAIDGTGATAKVTPVMSSFTVKEQ